MSTWFDSPWVGNSIVIAVLALAGWAAQVVRNNAIWRQAVREIWRRRPLSIAVLGIYAAIGLTDSVTWTGGSTTGSDVVAAHQPRSVIDRMFVDHNEKSYSSPLAKVEFYGHPSTSGHGTVAHEKLRHPGGHVLGTDILGHDVLFVTLKGVRVALLIGGFTSLIAIPLALFLGVTAGFFGKWVDEAVFFVMSVLASMPSILLLIALVLVLGRGTVSVCLALAVTSWVNFCRISRAETFKLRELDYVMAARALGVSRPRTIFRHILPNLAHLVIIRFVLGFSSLVLSEAVLSWLGLGVDGSWGQMLARAKDELSRDPAVWWNLAASATAMFTLLLAINFVGDALRDVLDPRTLRENA